MTPSKIPKTRENKVSLKEMTYQQRKAFLSEMTYSQRKKLLHELVIKYPRFDNYLRQIKNCHEQFGYSTEPDCLFIGGNTGAGKSTLKDTYASDFPREDTSEGTKIPVFSSSIPSRPTVKGIVSKLLYDLGDPRFDKGTEVSMTARLLGLLKDCEVELILLDELNFLLDRESNKFPYSATEKIKEIITDSKIPIVGFGLSETEQLLSVQVNSQLSRRFSERVILKPFAWFEEDLSSNNNGDEFRNLLHYIELYLPLIEKSNLANELMARRIYYASDGNISYVMSLMRGALDLALGKNEEKLDLDILAASFERRIKKEKPSKKNPFLEKKISIEELEKCNVETQINPVGVTNRRMGSNKSNLTASDVLHT